MNPTVFKSFRNILVAAFLVAGCGGAEPIPVDLATAEGPCDYGKEFVTEGMRMVMRDGQLTVEPVEEGQVRASWLGYTYPKNGAMLDSGCEGCH